MARQKPLKWYWQHCGNCPEGGVHQPNFAEGDTVILQNHEEQGEVVHVGKETFPHYFEVQEKAGRTYCETCFMRASDGFTVWKKGKEV